MGEQIEMSTAENIFGSVSNFSIPQTPSRPTFLFNIGLVGQPPNSSWTQFHLMMAPIQKRAITFENKWPKSVNSMSSMNDCIRILLHWLWRSCHMFSLWYNST